ncbi:MAG: FAD binding domain-containing protein [Pseudorhodoplanes sp.]
MKPAAFHYHCPTTIDEAVRLLSEVAPEDGRILAGGQSLIPTMALRMARPGHLVDINAIDELNVLSVLDDMLTIGAGVRHAAFHRPVVDGPLGALLTSVAKNIAHYPIRTRGTFCGSLAHADPAAEWCLTAATLDATIVARSSRGTRELKTDAFFDWVMTTRLAEDELLVEARLPLLAAETRFGFYEFSRRAGDYAIAMSLVTYMIVDNVIAHARVGIGGAEGRPRRIDEAEAVLNGKPASSELFTQAADAAAAAIDPMDDPQADPDYRRDLVRVVTLRALERAAA